MKVIGVSGSARTEGNTEIAVNIALEQLAKEGIETELIVLAGKRIEPCTACMGCAKEPRCVIEDDFGPIYEKIRDAEGLIVGSPVYFGSATPQTMALLDRVGYVARNNGNLLRHKVGGPIAIARRAGQNFTYAQMMFFYTINEMILVGSSYWNIAFGRGKGEIRDDEEGVETLETFGTNMAWVMKKLYGSV